MGQRWHKGPVNAADYGLGALGGDENHRPGGACEHQDREGAFLVDLLIAYHHCRRQYPRT